MAEDDRGAPFYFERARRALDAPPERRSADVRGFLEAHALIEAAVAVLLSDDEPPASDAYMAAALQHHPNCWQHAPITEQRETSTIAASEGLAALEAAATCDSCGRVVVGTKRCAKCRQQEGEDADAGLQGLLEQARAPIKPALGALEVFPEPGFVVKTADERGRKVFINVCSSDKVAMPGGWAGGEVPAEVRRALEAGPAAGGPPAAELGGAEQEMLRVPLSMSESRTEADHRGEACTVFDCIYSSELLRLAAAYRPLKYFLVQAGALCLCVVAMMWAESKHNLQLDPQYKLPKMRYKGDAPPPQLLRPDATARQGAGQQAGQQLIAEVEAPGTCAAEGPALALPVNRAAARAVAKAVPAPAAGAASAPVPPAGPAAGEGGKGDGEGGGSAVQLPALEHSLEFHGRPVEAVSLRVAGEEVVLAVPGCQPLAVRLPLAASARGGTAELAADGRELEVRLPYLPLAAAVAAARAAQGQQAPEQRGPEGEGASTVMELD
eukprot:scaffold7.g3490.t1